METVAEGIARTHWRGGLTSGHGQIDFASGAHSGQFSRASRFGGSSGTNPEELLAGAQATCLSMTIAALVEAQGQSVEDLILETTVTLSRLPTGGFQISTINVVGTLATSGLTDQALADVIRRAKQACPVSAALGGTTVTLLISPAKVN